MPPRRLAPAAAPDIAAVAAELVACGSLEMGADAPEDARRIAALLPAGTPVYVNHLPRHASPHTLAALVALREAGLEPVPHIAARRIASRAEAARRSSSRRCGRPACAKVLLIGGDVPRAARALRRRRRADARRPSRRRAACAGRPARLSGGPSAHRHGRARTRRSAEKLALAAAQGLGAYVVTQFSFAPNRIVEYCADLARRAPGVPVYVGLAGPDQPASRCCASRSAAASAPRCARCRRRACARCACSPTSTPPTS